METKRKAARDWMSRALRTPFSAVLAEAKITPRQREIVRLRFCEGYLNYQIAAELNVSPETVRDELAAVYDRVSAALAAL